MYSLTAYQNSLRAFEARAITKSMRRINLARGFRDLSRLSAFFSATQKDTSEKSNVRTYRYSRYEREVRCIIQRVHTERTGYREAFLIFTNSACSGSPAARICRIATWAPCMYIDRAMRRRLSEAENARDVDWREMLCFELIEWSSDTKATLKIRHEYGLIFLHDNPFPFITIHFLTKAITMYWQCRF